MERDKKRPENKDISLFLLLYESSRRPAINNTIIKLSGRICIAENVEKGSINIRGINITAICFPKILRITRTESMIRNRKITTITSRSVYTDSNLKLLKRKIGCKNQ
jgi:hypothetical protein